MEDFHDRMMSTKKQRRGTFDVEAGAVLFQRQVQFMLHRCTQFKSQGRFKAPDALVQERRGRQRTNRDLLNEMMVP